MNKFADQAITISPVILNEMLEAAPVTTSLTRASSLTGPPVPYSVLITPTVSVVSEIGIYFVEQLLELVIAESPARMYLQVGFLTYLNGISKQ